MHSYIRPNTHIALRLPSGILKILEIIPNTNISIGKYGTFPANLLLGRPYYLTFEISDKEDGKSKPELRVVPASELHAEALGNDHGTPTESRDEPIDGGVEFDIVGEDGEVIMRSNRLTVDDPSRQTLSMEEIEELKKAGAGSGKDIIAKIMASHLAIDEKTSFSLAKYTLRKSRKYLKRFTVLPLDVGLLSEYVIEKEAYKIMELREESLGLIGSWANIHCANASRILTAEDSVSQIGGGRWLIVDDTGGLVTAALAERMGILYSRGEDQEEESEAEEEQQHSEQGHRAHMAEAAGYSPSDARHTTSDTVMADADASETAIYPEGSEAHQAANGASDQQTPTSKSSDTASRPRKLPRQHIPQMSKQTNTLTVLHANNQPNLSLLKYFGFDTGNPVSSHPLYHHLKSISWLQFISPDDDPGYAEPEVILDEVLTTMKSSRRGNYYKKRRRWERTSRVIDETRQGGFDGLIVASVMEPTSILKECVHLLRGGGKVVVYSANVEPLVELSDYYSKERRAAYVARLDALPPTNGKRKLEPQDDGLVDDEQDDFPVNPTLLLAPSLQTARARHWQVLPGRTHPMMTSRGGAEGYLFTATRVLPVEGKVEARGTFRGKKRKTGPETPVQA